MRRGAQQPRKGELNNLRHNMGKNTGDDDKGTGLAMLDAMQQSEGLNITKKQVKKWANAVHKELEIAQPSSESTVGSTSGAKDASHSDLKSQLAEVIAKLEQQKKTQI
jgi:hypothetical protein